MEQTNRIICGDNLEVLKTLPSESVDLCYIDPPFFSGKNYQVIFGDDEEVRQFDDNFGHVRTDKDGNVKMTAGGLPVVEKDIYVYLEWMKPRLEEIHRVLKPTGSFYLHCDWHADAYLRVLCDGIFGYENLRSDIKWKRYGGVKNNATKKYSCQTDTIFYYTKSNKFTFKMQYRPLSQSHIDKKYKYKDDNGRVYALSWGKSYQLTGINKKLYLDETKGAPITTLWDDHELTINTSSSESLGYPTQKPEALLERIIKSSSNEGDVVMDAFCGCGTTLSVAKKLNRQFIGIDVSPTSCRLMADRLTKNGYIFPLKKIEGLPLTPSEIENLSGWEFQNWINREFGSINGKKGADGGIDGKLGDIPIQVKKYKAGRKDLDEFTAALYRENSKTGIYIALSYSSSFLKEVMRLKRDQEIDIKYFTVQDIFDGKHGEFKADRSISVQTKLF